MFPLFPVAAALIVAASHGPSQNARMVSCLKQTAGSSQVHALGEYGGHAYLHRHGVGWGQIRDHGVFAGIQITDGLATLPARDVRAFWRCATKAFDLDAAPGPLPAPRHR